MNKSQLILGATWFAATVLLSAAVLISTDQGIGSLNAALALSSMPTLLAFSIPIGVAALPSLIFFTKGRWLTGAIFAMAIGLFSWGVLQLFQTTASPLTIQKSISLLPVVLLGFGSVIVFTSFPAGLLFRIARRSV